MRGSLHALAVLIGSVVLGSAATACGGSSQADGGFERFEGEGVSVEYPAGWKVEDAEGDFLLNVRGPRDDRGLFVRLTISRADRFFPTIAQYGGSIARARPGQLREGRALESERQRVPGSDGGWRVVTNLSTLTREREEVPARAIELLAVTDDHQYNLTLVGPHALVDAPEAQRILDSFRVVEG